jgi:hypothetical protein
MQKRKEFLRISCSLSNSPFCLECMLQNMQESSQTMIMKHLGTMTRICAVLNSKLKLSFKLGWVGGKFPKLPERRCRIFFLPTAFMSLLPVAEHWLTLRTVSQLSGNACRWIFCRYMAKVHCNIFLRVSVPSMLLRPLLCAN